MKALCVVPRGDGHKFYGKERDTESGLDNFGARYDASSLGRFMTPDWTAVAMPVPYANLYNPQSLNLYSDVLNNPLASEDEDGHGSCKDDPDLCRAIRDAVSAGRSIEEGWANRLNQIGDKLSKGVKSAKKDLDTFNSVLGFGKTNCAGGGDCVADFGQAVTAVIAGIASDGESELGGAEGILRTAEGKIANILEDHLTAGDLEAAQRESNGERLLKRDGTPWNHREEVSGAVAGLERQVKRLQRALGKSGLSDSQVERINNLIEKSQRGIVDGLKSLRPSI